MPRRSRSLATREAGIGSQPKKRKPKSHPASEHRIGADEARDIRRIVSGTGQGIAGAGREFANRRRAEAALVPLLPRSHPSSGLLSVLERNLGRMGDTYKGFGEGALDLAKKTPGAINDLANFESKAYSGDPKAQETVYDNLLGKSATNLLLHGDTSHPYAAGAEIGSMLPIFRGARAALKLGSKGAKAAKAVAKVTPETQKVREALGPAKTTVGEGPLGVADVLPAASKARRVQEKGYSVERGKRFGRAAPAFGQAGGGLAGHHAAKGQLPGELPKVEFNMLRESGYGQKQLDRDIDRIYEHPDLKQGAMTHAADALEGMALHGVVPQKAQIKLLRQVFTDDGAAERIARTLSGWTGDFLSLFRSLMTTFDLSLNMRQALPLLFRNPNIWRKSIGPQMKALLKEGEYQKADDLLMSDADMKLALEVNPRAFTHREGRAGLMASEYFPSPLAEKIPGIKHPVRASSRAFEIGQNLGILNSFKSMLARAAKRGINIDPDTTDGLKELEGMLEVAAAQVGRGIFKTKLFRGAQPLLGHGLFAPSYYKSRLTWFSPRWYIKLPKVARYEAARTMLQFLGGTGAILYGASQIPGIDVTPDPRSSDFGKIRIGDTRLDAMGGFQQYARLAAQIYSGQYVDTKTGRVIDMKPGIGNRTRRDVVDAFITGKLSPPASFINDMFNGTDYQYRPFEWKRAVVQRMTPLVLQDMWQVYGQTGSVPAAVAAYGASATGIGVQTYDNAAKKQQKVFKDWESEATTSWKEIHPGQVLPAVVVRAKRDSEAVAEIIKGLPGRDTPEKDRTPEQQIQYEHAELSALLDYFVKSKPEMAQYQASYDKLLSSAPYTIHKAIPAVKKALYGDVLEGFNAQLNAMRKRKTYAR